MFGIGKLADHTVLEKLEQADEQILIYLYHEHHTAIKSFVLKNDGDENEAEDIVQNTIITVWKNATKSDFVLQSKLSDYIMRTAKNLWFKVLKKRTKFQLVDESNKAEQDAEITHLEMNQSIIVSLIDEMDDTSRKLLSYFYFDGLTTKLIAKKLQLANPNMVKSKKYQCFKKLRTSVMSHYEKDDLG